MLQTRYTQGVAVWNQSDNGDPLEQQARLAATAFGAQACRGNGDSVISGCIQQVCDQLEAQGPVGGPGSLPQGGKYDFSFNNIMINGALVSPDSFNCFMSRCGTFDSLDYSHGDGTFHVDTANVWFLPFGALEHLLIDLIGGNTWWSGGIPRPSNP